MRGAFAELDPPNRLLRHFDMPAVHAPDHEKGWTYFLGERLVASAGAA